MRLLYLQLHTEHRVFWGVCNSASSHTDVLELCSTTSLNSVTIDTVDCLLFAKQGEVICSIMDGGGGGEKHLNTVLSFKSSSIVDLGA